MLRRRLVEIARLPIVHRVDLTGLDRGAVAVHAAAVLGIPHPAHRCAPKVSDRTSSLRRLTFERNASVRRRRGHSRRDARYGAPGR
jgi:hypothetical protein